MRWDARGATALLASALVGITAGVVLGFTTGSPDPSTADDNPSGTPSVEPAPDDPLGLGIDLVNLACNQEKGILVVGYGETRGRLNNAVSANSDADVKYLETAKSCDTLYGAENRTPPTYVAYLGPFDDLQEPCQLRMSVDHTNDVVTSLRPGTKIHVQCLCELSLDEQNFPELAVGMKASTRDGIFVRALQRLLVETGRNPERHITGYYDDETATIIKDMQVLNALDPTTYKVVDLQTWRVIRDLGCLGDY